VLAWCSAVSERSVPPRADQCSVAAARGWQGSRAPTAGAHIVQAPRPGRLGFGADEGTAESESCLFIRRDVARAAEPASTDSRIRLLRDCRLPYRPPSLHDAEGEMRDTSALDHPGAFQLDRLGALVEQPDAIPQ
jgi:hypothetical protein